jgi:hypothetical protein
MEAEIKKARNLYWWLWLSPLLTIPTLVAVLIIQPGHDILCAAPGQCDYLLSEHVSLIAAVIISSLWHLILLKPISDKSKPFVRWHGQQALILAGLRASAALFFAVVFGFDLGFLLAFPTLIFIWFLGTIIGQYQATKGSCSLARWLGCGDELAGYANVRVKAKVRKKEVVQSHQSHWVNVIRYSKDPEERRKALAVLKQRNVVEEF